jgi:hypothetical protein
MFKPDLTPLQILKLGAFGNSYFFNTSPSYLKSFPNTWHNFLKADSDVPNKSKNLFGVNSGLSLDEWIKKGWIHKQDPLGWFQWYCHYYLNRRSEDDERQIKRHRAFVRHYKACFKQGKNNPNLHPVRRQALLHWGYDPFPDIDTLEGESVYKKCLRLKKLLTKKDKIS